MLDTEILQMVKDVATKINEMTIQINDANNKLKLLMETPDKIYEQIEYLTRDRQQSIWVYQSLQ